MKNNPKRLGQKGIYMSDPEKRRGKHLSLRTIFEGAAVSIAATATVAAVLTAPTLPAMVMGVAFSAAYLLKKRI